MSKRIQPLAGKLFYGVLPSTLAVILFLSYFSYLAAKRQILAGVNQQIVLLARQAADHLSAFFNLRNDDASVLADSTLLRDYLKYLSYDLKEEAESHRKELGEYYSRIARERSVYNRISYYNGKGREVAAGTSDGPIERGLETNPAFSEAPPRGQVRHTGIAPGKSREIIYWAGVYNDLGRAQGSVVLRCDLRRVLELLDTAKIGRMGQTFLIGPDDQNLLSHAGPPLFQDVISGEARIPGTAWKIRLTARSGEFLAPLHRVERWTAVVSLVAVIFIFAWIGYFVRRATYPITTLAEGTKRIAEGDLDFRVNPSFIRELDALGESFNDMAAKLKERNRQLESRIRQLTALREMDGAVIQQADEEAALRACLRMVAAGLSLDCAALYWVDEARKEISGRYIHGGENSGLTEDSFRQRRVPLGENDVLNRVIRTRSAILERPPAGSPRSHAPFPDTTKTQEFVAAPICGKDRVFGILTADNNPSRRPLQESDREGLSLFANAIGLALENATLFQHLAQSEARYRSVVENSPVAVLGLSRELHITTWNQRAEEMFGYSSEEMSGKPVNALFPQEANRQFKDLLSEMLAKGSVRDYSMPGIGKGGRKLDLSLSWGGPHREFWMNREWALVIRDVTEARKLQQQLIQSEKLSVVGQLISSIAHELNNPLQAVVGYAQLLADQGLGASGKAARHSEFQEDLKEILQSALRCRKIIENLLFFVRQGGVNKEAVRLDAAIRASLELLEYKLTRSDTIHVQTKIDKRLPRVYGNPQQIQQVFINLVNNARDAMAGQKNPKIIWIRASAADNRVRLEVEDSGPGVPPEIRQKIFEAFFTTKPPGHGTGIGLALCSQIVQDHGGRMGVSSGAGGGALFWMEFPGAAPSPQAAAPKRKAAALQVPGKSVLLVDDEAAVVSLLRQVIESDSGIVESAGTLEEAFQKAGQRFFDLVVVDVFLPDGKGLDLLEKWSGRSNFPKPKFLFITGDVLNDTPYPRLAKLGLPVLHKPIDLQAFLQAMRSALANKSASG